MNRTAYQALVHELIEHDRRYYDEAKPTISDYEYDQKLQKLLQIEKEHPDWALPNSPTQRIGETATKGFHQKEHLVPMYSLDNTYSKEELATFIKRVHKLLEKDRVPFCCELKIDGVAISMLYEKGRLVHALTRGNGRIGDDVTANIKTIKTVPLTIDAHERMEIRGEVHLTVDAFNQLNEQRDEEGLEPFANPRNAAAGSLKLLDPGEVAKRKLHLLCYSFAEGQSLEKTQYESTHALKKMGFPVAKPEYVVRANDLEEIWQFAEKIGKNRPKLPFQIDGIVVKVDDLRSHDILGVTGKSPRYAIAYKFAPEEAYARVKEITVQVGRTGVLTPVAELEPVLLAGSTISRSTLHNGEEVARKDVRVGDLVVIEKAGDVIPQVTRVDLSQRPKDSKPWHMPKECPICHTAVVHRQEEVAIRCPNPKCKGQRLRRILHFASKQAMDIEHMGESVVEQLVEKGLISRPSDIYTLDELGLAQLEGFKEKSISNLLESIDASRTCTLARFIMGLGIKYVGVETAELLAEHSQDLDHLLSLTESDLIAMEGIGNKTAQAIIEALHDPEIKAEIKSLLAHGVDPKQSERKISGHPFSGKTFVLTGTLSHYKRDEAAKLIKERGGRVSGSISKETDYLLLGEDPGSKYDKAKKLGTQILSEQQFQKML